MTQAVLPKFQAALALHQKGELPAAQTLYEEILREHPGNFDALHLLGAIAAQRGNPTRALDFFNRAIAINAGYAEAHYNRGVVLQQLGQLDGALASYDRAIALQADHAAAWFNRANLLKDRKQFDAAAASYNRAIASQPRFAEAFMNRGNVQRELEQLAAAMVSFDQAIAINPRYAEAHANRGHALRDLKQYEAAIAAYSRGLALKPDIGFLQGQRLQVKMQICDWNGLEAELAELGSRVERGEAVCNPFFLLALSDSAALHKKAAQIWVREECRPNCALPVIPKRARRGKIRLGYFSADFRNHAVSILAAELFEIHDRSKFEVTAFSFGPDTRDEMRQRLQGAFDRFTDVRGKSDRDVALLARQMELDIAVDLGGFTTGSRSNVFALRAAPLQIGYLGYLGTTAANYMDYLIADDSIVPAAHQEHYTEKLVYLPSYQVNDSKRCIPDRHFTRGELGLPARGFVFCCFNDCYKITPDTFDSWMRVVAKVQSSVLFLYAASESAQANLRKEAVKRGVEPHRLVFGGKLSYADYLARYRSADLFLDTLPYNAGTTASDALWAGLPVLTCAGETFAGRVASSLLNAVRLPELVATTRTGYEELAVALATDPARLTELRRRLADNRLGAPLFDTRRFARNIEAAFVKIHERYCADVPPDNIRILDIA